MLDAQSNIQELSTSAGGRTSHILHDQLSAINPKGSKDWIDASEYPYENSMDDGSEWIIDRSACGMTYIDDLTRIPSRRFDGLLYVC